MALADAPSSEAAGGFAAEAAGDDGTAVLWLRGELDLASVDAIAAALAGMIALDEADLVIDLRDVEFMDASTYGVLGRCQVLLQQRSRAMTLRAPSTAAQLVLDLCGLISVDAAPARGDPGGNGVSAAEDGRS